MGRDCGVILVLSEQINSSFQAEVDRLLAGDYVGCSYFKTPYRKVVDATNLALEEAELEDKYKRLVVYYEDYLSWHFLEALEQGGGKFKEDEDLFYQAILNEDDHEPQESGNSYLKELADVEINWTWDVQIPYITHD